MLAKEWAKGRNHWLFAAGLVAFGALFAVYAVSSRVLPTPASPTTTSEARSPAPRRGRRTARR